MQIDQLKSKTQLLSIIRSLTNGHIAGKLIPGKKGDKKILDKGYSKFSDVFMVSALNGDGVSDIRVDNLDKVLEIIVSLNGLILGTTCQFFKSLAFLTSRYHQ